MSNAELVTMVNDFIHPRILQQDPLVLNRLAKIKRQEAIMTTVNSALEKKSYSRAELFQVCLQERVVEVGSYRQFKKDLDELEDAKLISISKIREDSKQKHPPAWFSGTYLRRIMQQIREDQKLTWEQKARLCVAILLGLRQGMRCGEVSRLKWMRIKFDEDKLIIWSSKSKNKSQNKFREGKTRIINLMPDLKPILRKFKEMQGVANDNCYLFPSNVDPSKPLKTKTIGMWLEEILKKIGLRGKNYLIREPQLDKNGKEKRNFLYRYHTLRHTCAYHILVVTDGDYDTAQAFLGHDSVDTTKQYYAELVYKQVGRKILRGEKRGLKDFNINTALQRKFEEMNRMMDTAVGAQTEAYLIQQKDRDKDIELERLRIQRLQIERGVAK